MTPWEARIRELVFAANPDECALTNDSRADNIILSTFVECGTKIVTRDDYVYVVFGEQNPGNALLFPKLVTVSGRLAQVPDMTEAADVAFALQPPVPPASVFIQV